MSEGPAVVEEQHGRVLVLRINRPEARNALNYEVLLKGVQAEALRVLADGKAVGNVLIQVSRGER